MANSESHECSYCQNDFPNEEYNPITKQCVYCDKFDEEEPTRKKEREIQDKWESENQHMIKHLGSSSFRWSSGDF